MKYLIILGDGMAGESLERLGDKTTLEWAKTPEMDRLAAKGEIGLASMVPEGMAPGSDTANLSVLGYDPRKYYTGRSPLEAFSIGVNMAEDDISFRCNLVTLTEDERLSYEKQHMVDHSSDEICTEDAAILIAYLKEHILRMGFSLYTGTSYRHLLLWEKGKRYELTPPHDILTKEIRAYLPEDALLCSMMEQSYELLKVHPLNMERKKCGLRPANSAWFWGAGSRPKLPDFYEKTGKKGVMISAVDLLKGIAAAGGMTNLHVEGATGGLHTNYEGKAQAAVHALLKEGYDFAYIHVEAPDEMGHQGSIPDKIKAIENIDQKIIGPIVGELEDLCMDFRMLVLPDHPTPICVRTHTGNPVPYLLYDSRKKAEGMPEYSERLGNKSPLFEKEGHRLLSRLFEMDNER